MNAQKREIIRIEPLRVLENIRLRVAGYARVSSDSDDQLNSFVSQVSYYTKIIRENDSFELVDIYADEGITGVSLQKRNDFNRMLEDCRDGKIDRIITKSISRFGRNTVDNISVLRELQSRGVSVYFEKEGIDTKTISSENMLTLYSLFAQQESISISQNCKKGARMRMASGTYISSNAPYGYRLINSQLQVFWPEALIVQRIFREYLEGKGTEQIARDLSSDNIKCKKDGIEWWHTTVRKILRNERYTGNMLLQKTFSEDVIPYKKHINNGELPQYYIKETHESIISEIQFEIVQMRLGEQKLHNNVICGEYLLSKKIYCKSCGFIYRRKLINETAYWVCRNHDRNSKNCQSQNIQEDEIYTAFIRMYNKLKANKHSIFSPLLRNLEKLREQNCRDNEQLSNLNKQIAETAEQNHVMTGLMSKGILDSAIFISQTDELKAKLQHLKQQKSRLLRSVEKDTLFSKIEELSQIIDNGPCFITDMVSDIFEELIEKIEADNNNIDFILLGGLTLTERL